MSEPRRSPGFGARILNGIASVLGYHTDAEKRRSERRAHLRAGISRVFSDIRAKYDSAQTTDENKKHWANADDLSARGANPPEIRRTLRRRSRYEYSNNSYCKGIVATLAGDMIGTGPRLQLMFGHEGREEASRFIEREFRHWCDAIDLPGKLLLHEQSRHVDGEGIGLLTTNRALKTRVKLDLRILEAEQMTTPDLRPNDPLAVDGIRFDAYGNPFEYHILPYHPADVYSPTYKRIPAAQVLHWFTPNRPGEVRGVPTLTPALDMFGKLRRYCMAVLMAAEIAAELAAFIQTNLAPDDEEAGEAWELLEIVRGQITTLPQGWSINQLNPTQPTTGFAEFVNTILREIARCLQMPWGIAAGDSSQYNYASGRLDVQTYVRKIKIERDRYERTILDRIFTAWLQEASLIEGYLPLKGLPPVDQWAWRWHWDQFEHVDPSKEANALKTLLEINAITMEDIYAAKGRDWVEAFMQLAKEKKEMDKLGIALPGTSPAKEPAPEETPGALPTPA